MGETISLTINQQQFKSVFKEVTISKQLSWPTESQLRLFHLNIRGNKIVKADLVKFLYINAGNYVLSRAKSQQMTLDGTASLIGAQGLRMLKKSGTDIKGSGSELGEMLNYAFLEGELGAPKLMSRIEVATDGSKYSSSCDGIHLLTNGISGKPYHQLVFGSSSIVGDPRYAVDAAFEQIAAIDEKEDSEIQMVDSLVFDRLMNPDEIELVKNILIPQEDIPSYQTSYGVFLGYSLGLDKNKVYPVADYLNIVEAKMKQDADVLYPYILNKINSLGLSAHSFYFYLLPLDDAEDDKKEIMNKVAEGDVEL